MAATPTGATITRHKKTQRAKLLALTALVCQNCSLVFILRWSRTAAGTDGFYIPSTAVFLAEIVKLVVSVGLYLSTSTTTTTLSPRGANHDSGFVFWNVAHAVLGPHSGCWTMCIPALAYAVQNWLQYIAIERLDAPTFQVTAQLKILATAVCFVVILRKRLSGMQWASLAVLTGGVVLCQLVKPTDVVSGEVGVEVVVADEGSDGVMNGKQQSGERLLGFLCMLLAATLSGLAGVYFEKMLKTPLPPSDTTTIISSPTTNPTLPPNIWIRNIQLSLFSIAATGVFGLLILDRAEIVERGFWAGYGVPGFMAVGFSALGGIIVAVVVQAADNVVKGFATSIAIVLSTLLSPLFSPANSPTANTASPPFVLGTAMVVTATVMYARGSSSGGEMKRGGGSGGGKGLPRYAPVPLERSDR
ncbi:nucleotide-sugar transporter-domain-containing protein [Powellomyces hirtus]|nr:nucleotide-sugar transporter-domain-containing protein [Powellomyces hirtus]